MKIGFLADSIERLESTKNILESSDLSIYGIYMDSQDLTREYADSFEALSFLSPSSMLEMCDCFILNTASLEAFDLVIKAVKAGKPVAISSYDLLDSEKMCLLLNLLHEVHSPVWINSCMLDKGLFDVIDFSKGLPSYIEVNCHVLEGNSNDKFLGGIDFISRIVKSPLKKVSKICLPTTPEEQDLLTIRLEFLSGSNAILKLNSPLQSKNEIKGVYHQSGQAVEFIIRDNEVSYRSIKKGEMSYSSEVQALSLKIKSFFEQPEKYSQESNEMENLLIANEILEKIDVKTH